MPDDIAAISLLDEPVRRRLYDLVSDRGEPVGRDAAARAIGITRSLASFHLDRLVAGGLLTADYRRLSGRSGPGAGRPAKVYSRAQRDIAVSLPERRYQLAADLFAQALEQLEGEEPPPQLCRAAESVGEQLGAAGGGLMETLASNGYEPTAEPSGAIRLRNCPFHALVEDHRPMVCGTNLALGQGITHGTGTREYDAVLDPQPGFCCLAFVRNS